MIKLYNRLKNGFLRWDRDSYVPPARKLALTVFIIAVACNALDGILTVLLLNMDLATELNGLVQYAYDANQWLFIAIKVAVGTIALTWLYVRGVPDRHLAWYTLIACCGFFLLLTLYYGLSFAAFGIIDLIY